MSLRASTLVGCSLLSFTALAQTGPVNAVIVSSPGPEAVIRPATEPSNPTDAQRSLAYFAGTANQVRIRAGEVFLCADFSSSTGRTTAQLLDLNGDSTLLSNVNSYGGWQNDTGGFRFVRDATAGWQLRVDVSGNARCYSNFQPAADLVFRNGFEGTGVTIASGSAKGSAADLSIEVLAPANAVVGQPFSYTVRIRNLGGTAVSGIQIKDWYPKVAGASQVNDPVIEVAGAITCTATTDSSCGSITQGGTLAVTAAALAAGGTLEYVLPRRMAAGTPNSASFRVRAAVFGPMTLTETFGNNAVLSNEIAAATDAAPAVTASTPTNGATVASNTPLQLSFSEAVNTTAGAVTLSCTPAGGSAQTIALTGTAGSGVTVLNPTYTGALPQGANCTLTVLANQVSDVDALDPPDVMAANFVSTFSVDAAPAVTGGAPAGGASGVALNSAITYVFSEPVTFAQTPVNQLNGAPAEPMTVLCGGNSVAGTFAGSGTNTVTFTPTQPLPGSSTCTVSGDASRFRDADGIDPPDQPASIPSRSFTTTDAPPAVVATTPANGSVAASNTALSVTFSEPVDAFSDAIRLTCNGNNVPLSNVLGSYINPPTIVPTYTGSLSNGASCTLRVVANRISDRDGIDPANMTADVVVNFTVDAPPALTSFSPTDGASGVATNAPVVLNFSERVNVAVGAVALECPVGTPRTLTGLPATDVDSVSLLAQGGFPAGTQCRVTVNAGGITDVDAADPPDTLSSSTFFNFGVANPN